MCGWLYLMSHICPINARLGILWPLAEFVGLALILSHIIWTHTQSLALSHIFDPIFRVFAFPSQKTFAAFFLYFLQKIKVGRISYEGFQGPSEWHIPTQKFLKFSPPWRGALFQAPLTNLMALIYLGCRLSW